MAVKPYGSRYEGLKPNRPNSQSKVKCNKCKQFSGYENKDLLQRVSETKILECKNCGKPTIKLIPTGLTYKTNAD